MTTPTLHTWLAVEAENAPWTLHCSDCTIGMKQEGNYVPRLGDVCHSCGITEDTLLVPRERIEAVREKIAKLAARAKKLGVDAPGIEHEFFSHRQEYRDEHGKKFSVYWHAMVFSPAIQRVGLSGWTFVARLDDDGFIWTAPGETVPPEWRSRGNICQHCNTHRKRASTFLVRHNDGTFKLVGHSCLKDFLGVDWQRMAQYASLLKSLADDMRDFSNEPREPYYFPLLDYLTTVCWMARELGYVSAKRAKERWESSTANIAWSTLIRSQPSEAERQWEREHPCVEDDRKLAENILVQRKGAGFGESEYDHNMQLLFAADAVEFRTKGLAGSLYGWWMMQQPREERAPKPVSTWQGTLKARVELTLTILYRYDTDSHWGRKTMIKMEDAAHNIFVWWSTSDNPREWAVGNTVKLKGTIKKHDTYRDVQQTTLGRCTLLEVISEPAHA